MALFRKKTDSSVLPEVDQYYEAERRDRTGLAWLLALVSVAIVALILVGLFLAGRWAYRQVANNNDDTISVTSDSEDASFDGGDGTDESGDNKSKDKNKDKDGDDNAVDVTRGDTDRRDSQNDSDSDDNESADRDEAETVPVTGGDELPSTGPAATVALFVASSSVAGAAHAVVTRKRK